MSGKGFTLIELLVTMALLGLFSTLVLPLAELTVKRGREAELRLALRQIRDGLDAYKQAADAGRILVTVGDSGYPKKLAQLVDGVEDLKSPQKTLIYFQRRIPRDPFAETDSPVEQSWGLRSYKSSHDRPQPGDDVFDVYSQSTEMGMNGVPYREW